jgi:hypothetical protein
MTPELKKLGEMVLADPLLRNRVVVAKVRRTSTSSRCIKNL